MEEDKGYVALLDVLGFTELVSGENQKQRLTQYIDSLNEVTNGTEVEIVLFSDTIVMTSPGDTGQPLLNLLEPCSRAFGLLLSHEFAIRGAIAHGSFIRYKSTSGRGVFLAGRAIIDAYRFQQKQDWTGIMIAPSVLSVMPDLKKFCDLPATIGKEAEIGGLRARMKWLLFVQSCHSIPFQAEHPMGPQNYDGFAVVPTDRLPREPNEMWKISVEPWIA